MTTDNELTAETRHKRTAEKRQQSRLLENSTRARNLPYKMKSEHTYAEWNQSSLQVHEKNCNRHYKLAS
jgi:hypothetical protein